MSDYIKITDYAAKDALLTGNPAKLVKGTEIGADLDAVAVAVATKHDAADIGVTVQAYSPNLDEYAAVNPTAAGLAILDDATASNQLTTLGGTTVGKAVFTAATVAAAQQATDTEVGVDVMAYVAPGASGNLLTSNGSIWTSASASYAASGANADITSLTAVTAINRTGGTSLTGTNTNDSAAAGKVGEYVESVVAVGSSVAITSGVSANVTSISLTAGDWDVSGMVGVVSTAAGTSVTAMFNNISQSSASLDTQYGYYPIPATVPGSGNPAIVTAPRTRRFSLASTTTIYLVGAASFSVSTAGIYGAISARRVR